MKYLIEVDEKLNAILSGNAALRNMNVTALISEILGRYAVDAHIMEQTDVWEKGIDECADINLDWANL